MTQPLEKPAPTWRNYVTPDVLVPVAIIGFLCLILLWAFLPTGLYDYAPDFMQPKNPVRRPVFGAGIIHIKDYELTPVRSYKLDARLLGKHEYSTVEDMAADLAPIDMYFGWGPMSNPAVLNYLSINIYQRVANTGSWDIPPLHISTSELRRNSDNNHLIPATPEIAQSLKDAPVGAPIHLEGYFVDVRTETGFSWDTSLSYGWSAGITHPYQTMMTCKVIYVTNFSVVADAQ